MLRNDTSGAPYIAHVAMCGIQFLCDHKIRIPLTRKSRVNGAPGVRRHASLKGTHFSAFGMAPAGKGLQPRREMLPR